MFIHFDRIHECDRSWTGRQTDGHHTTAKVALKQSVIAKTAGQLHRYVLQTTALELHQVYNGDILHL